MIFDQKIDVEFPDSFAYYKNEFFSEEKSDYYFDYLMKNIDFINDKSVIYGKEITTKRKVSWQSNLNQTFTYSGYERVSTPFDKEVLNIKDRLELELGYEFNSCLLNLYHDGAEGMGWHTDKTKEFGKNTEIAVISFGSDRFFDIKTILGEKKQRINLEHGSLLVMGGGFQTHYKHQIPKQLKIKKARISLTFRQLNCK